MMAGSRSAEGRTAFERLLLDLRENPRKTTFLFLSMIALRWTLPRLRIDQVMYLCYKVLLPISMACLILAAFLRLFG